MTLFVGTLAVVLLCCLGLGLGLVLDGRPLSGGCGGKPGSRARCADCPKRAGRSEEPEGESRC